MGIWAEHVGKIKAMPYRLLVKTLLGSPAVFASWLHGKPHYCTIILTSNLQYKVFATNLIVLCVVVCDHCHASLTGMQFSHGSEHNNVNCSDTAGVQSLTLFVLFHITLPALHNFS